MIRGLKKKLDSQGYVFIPCLKSECGTEALAKEIGKLFKVSEINGYERISNIQSLKPRTKRDDIKNQYSGHFGLSDFPLHTDLAYWMCPPRYILLRCIVGSSSVSTKILSSKIIRQKLGESIICRAVVKSRKRTFDNANYFLPVYFKEDGVPIFRWDSIFLLPVNETSREIYSFLSSKSVESDINYQILQRPGDTLIIDNWKTLHGRSAVGKSSYDRFIERTYLSDIKV